MIVSSDLSLNALAADLAPNPPRIRVVDAVDSTQSALKQQLRDRHHAEVLIAKEQTQGRGRRGRPWHSPPGVGLYLSYAHPTHQSPETLAPLGLVVGASIARILGPEVHIKWPNDWVIQATGRWAKVGGCLIELVLHEATPHVALIGIGLNLALGTWLAKHPELTPDQPWADVPNAPPINSLAAGLINGLSADLAQFEQEGFSPFRAQWLTRHAFADQTIDAHLPDGQSIRGIAGAIDERGQLEIVTDTQTLWLNAGEVSIRSHPRP